MHIAILIGHFPPGSFGGAEIQAEGWAKRLCDRHRVTVLTRRDAPEQPAREQRDGFTVIRLPVSRVPFLRTIADIGAIGRELERLEPRPDVLLCFQTFVSGLAGVNAGRRLGIPVVVWIRGEAEYHLGASRFARHYHPGVWKRSAALLVQSESNRIELLRELERHAPGVLAGARAKLEVVPNGLDLPSGPFEGGAGVLSVGRLVPEKGMDTVIDAVAAMRGALTIAGDGPERARLEARARARGIAVTFAGFADRERLERLYRTSACVVLAARHGEGLPNVLLEAMACARPVLATPCAGTRDLLVDGVNGLLVAPDDVAALAAALERLASESGLAGRLGVAARRTAEDFAWEHVRPRLESVLARVSGR